MMNSASPQLHPPAWTSRQMASCEFTQREFIILRGGSLSHRKLWAALQRDAARIMESKSPTPGPIFGVLDPVSAVTDQGLES